MEAEYISKINIENRNDYEIEVIDDQLYISSS